MSKMGDLVNLVEPGKRPIAEGLVTELAFMKGQLAKLRKTIRENGCTELFTQGRQSMERLTPSFQAYSTLTTRYGQLAKQLAALVPDGADAQGDELDAFLRELGE